MVGRFSLMLHKSTVKRDIKRCSIEPPKIDYTQLIESLTSFSKDRLPVGKHKEAMKKLNEHPVAIWAKQEKDSEFIIKDIR